MIEIIVLIFLTREIGRIAEKKGLKKIKWKVILVSLWLLLEFAGVITGLLIFSPDNLFSIAMVGLMFASTSYFIVKGYLLKLPDQPDESDIG